MLNKFDNAFKLLKLSQCAFMICTLLYLLESLFIRGLFTNIYLFIAALILGCISTIIALIKKAYLFVAIDVTLIMICSLIFFFLIYV